MTALVAHSFLGISANHIVPQILGTGGCSSTSIHEAYCLRIQTFMLNLIRVKVKHGLVAIRLTSFQRARYQKMMNGPAVSFVRRSCLRDVEYSLAARFQDVDFFEL